MQRHVTVNFIAKYVQNSWCSNPVRLLTVLFRIDELSGVDSDNKRRVVDLEEKEEIKQDPIHLQAIPGKSD